MKRRRERFLKGFTNTTAVVVFCSLIIGCGYQFRPAGSPLNGELESIAIPPFSSSSSYAGVEQDFAAIVRQEFISHSRVRIENETRARAVLRGDLHSITTEPLTYTVTRETIHGFVSTDEVTQSRIIRVSLTVTVTDRVTGETIWQDAHLTEKAIFQVSLDPLVTQYNQRLALNSIAREVAKRIFSRTMDRF